MTAHAAAARMPWQLPVTETPVQIINGNACMRCRRPFTAKDTRISSGVPGLVGIAEHPEGGCCRTEGDP